MTTPENPQSPEQNAREQLYPYHPEAWQEICALSEVGLAEEVEVVNDSETGESTFMAKLWRVNRLGFACRLERPIIDSRENTIYTLGFEDDAPGRHFGRVPFISVGMRRPVTRNPRNYGILEYSRAQGLIKEPAGVLPNNYIRSIAKVEDMDNPDQRIVGFERLLKDLLSYAPRGWEEPVKLPDYNRRRR